MKRPSQQHTKIHFKTNKSDHFFAWFFFQDRQLDILISGLKWIEANPHSGRFLGLMWWKGKTLKWSIKQTCRNTFKGAQEEAIKIFFLEY